MTRIEESQQLRKKSGEFLELAEISMERNLHSLVLFNVEQSLQLLLKSKLLEGGSDFPHTHSVKRLLEILSDISPDVCRNSIIALTEKYLLELGLIEDSYINSRYGGRDYEKSEVEKVFAGAREIIDGIKKNC